jgi:hypothetical protein
MTRGDLVLAALALGLLFVGAMIYLSDYKEPDYNERYTICAVVQEPPGMRCITADSMEFFQQ